MYLHDFPCLCYVLYTCVHVEAYYASSDVDVCNSLPLGSLYCMAPHTVCMLPVTDISCYDLGVLLADPFLSTTIYMYMQCAGLQLYSLYMCISIVYSRLLVLIHVTVFVS